jgi:LPS export ABC transporter protein LptC
MNRRRLAQRVLLTVVVLALTAAVAVFVGYRRMTRHPEVGLELLKEKADMQLNKISQNAMKNGIREWHLEADSATLIENEKTMLLAAPDVVFFMEDGDHVHLTAEQGTIYTDSSRMNVSGQVSASTNLYRFQTETLDYDPGARQLRADTPVTLSGQSFTLRADTMTMNLETSVTHFEGRVEGTISEDLQL